MAAPSFVENELSGGGYAGLRGSGISARSIDRHLFAPSTFVRHPAEKRGSLNNCSIRSLMECFVQSSDAPRRPLFPAHACSADFGKGRQPALPAPR
jgi:hypothetical protein